MTARAVLQKDLSMWGNKSLANWANHKIHHQKPWVRGRVERKRNGTVEACSDRIVCLLIFYVLTYTSFEFTFELDAHVHAHDCLCYCWLNPRSHSTFGSFVEPRPYDLYIPTVQWTCISHVALTKNLMMLLSPWCHSWYLRCFILSNFLLHNNNNNSLINRLRRKYAIYCLFRSYDKA